MPTCSYCGTEYQDEPVQCSQCGKAFREDPADLDPRRAAGQKLMLRGALWFCVGAGATLFSYAQATQYGGRYVIAGGAIAYGLAQFFRGRAAAAGRIEAKEEGHALLELAARLESVDRT